MYGSVPDPLQIFDHQTKQRYQHHGDQGGKQDTKAQANGHGNHKQCLEVTFQIS